MKVKFLTAMDTEAGVMPVGTMVDHPDCFLLADLGHAVEADDEAAEALQRWREAKSKPLADPRQDNRFDGFKMAGRDVPTVFTRPDGSRVQVSAGQDGVSVVTELQEEPVDA